LDVPPPPPQNGHPNFTPSGFEQDNRPPLFPPPASGAGVFCSRPAFRFTAPDPFSPPPRPGNCLRISADPEGTFPFSLFCVSLFAYIPVPRGGMFLANQTAGDSHALLLGLWNMNAVPAFLLRPFFGDPIRDAFSLNPFDSSSMAVSTWGSTLYFRFFLSG